LLGGVAFDEGGVDRVGEGELGEVAGGVVFLFVGCEAGCRRGSLSKWEEWMEDHVRASFNAFSFNTSIVPASNVTALMYLLYTITTLSYLTPLFTIKSATALASANVGISFPIWFIVNTKFWGRDLRSWALDLSPTTTMGESWAGTVKVWEATCPGLRSGSMVPVAMRRRVPLETEEWTPPQRPLSEEMTMKSLRGAAEDCSGVASVCLKSSGGPR